MSKRPRCWTGAVCATLLLAAACVPTPGNQRPTASFVADRVAGAQPLVVHFDASSSTDVDGTIVEWSWNFGDGELAAGETAVHEFEAGSFEVTLTVVDDLGAVAVATQRINAIAQDLFEPVSELTGVQGARHFVDFDGDGDLDVLGATRIYLANGDGTYTPGFPFGYSTRFNEVVDFNNDLAPDLLLYERAQRHCNEYGFCYTESWAKAVILINDGAGDFSVTQIVAGQKTRGPLEEGRPTYAEIAVGDVNGDGTLDLLAGPYGLSVFIGAGDGTFSSTELPHPSFSVSPQELGDLDGDGDLDIWSPGFGVVGLGDGSGGFVAQPQGEDCVCRLVDVDQDGVMELFGLDVVYTLDGWRIDVMVAEWLGTSFSEPVRQRVEGVEWSEPAGGRSPREVSTISDMNADGDPDLVIVSGGQLIVAAGGPGATLGNVTVSDIGTTAGRVLPGIGDLNNDGFSDVVVWGTDEITTMLMNDGQASFEVLSSWAGRIGIEDQPPVIADIDGDGYADLVRHVYREFDRVHHNPGMAPGVGSTARTVGSPGAASTLEVADLNDDGMADAVVHGDEHVEVFLGRADGQIVPSALLGPLSPSLVVHTLVDVNNDGWFDLVATDGGQVAIFLGDGLGAFAPQLVSSAGAVGADLEVGDLDGDGLVDVVGKSADSQSLWVATGLGNGGFADAVTAAFADIVDFALGDVNNDSVDEVVLNANLQVANNVWTDDTHVLAYEQPGTLVPAGPSIPLVGWSSPRLVDTNNDGWLDLISGTRFAEGTNPVTVYSGTTVRLGDGTGAFPVVVGRQLDTPCAGGALPYADLDGDGLLDVVSCVSPQEIKVESGVGELVAPAADAFFAIAARAEVGLGDQNGDGLVDLFSLVDDLGAGDAPALAVYRGMPAAS